MERIEFYDGTNYGGVIYRITVILDYSLMVDMLKKCPQTDDYKLLLTLIKAIKKSPNLEAKLERTIPLYKNSEVNEPWSEETGWKDNKIGFMAHDAQGKCKKISLWISYDLLLDMVFTYGDGNIIKELQRIEKTEELEKKLKKRLDNSKS